MSTTILYLVQTIQYDMLEDGTGAGGGFVSGLVTQQQVLDYLGEILDDFLSRTGMIWQIAAQNIVSGQSQYTVPDSMPMLMYVFQNACVVDKIDLNSTYILGSWVANPGRTRGYHQDGLPIKTMEIIPAPNWNGGNYTGIQPSLTGTIAGPFTISSGINDTLAISVNGGALQFVVLAGGSGISAATIASEIQAGVTGVTCSSPGGVVKIAVTNPSLPVGTIHTDESQFIVSGYANAVLGLPTSATNYGGNPFAPGARDLTLCGTSLASKETWGIGDTLDTIPDSCTPYLIFGVEEKIFSSNAESRDMQRAEYCRTRYEEGVSFWRTIVMTMIGDEEERR